MDLQAFAMLSTIASRSPTSSSKGRTDFRSVGTRPALRQTPLRRTYAHDYAEATALCP